MSDERADQADAPNDWQTEGTDGETAQATNEPEAQVTSAPETESQPPTEPEAAAEQKSGDVPDFMFEKESSDGEPGEYDFSPPEPENIPLALGAGAAAAVASGIVWALLVAFTGMEIGIVAWGIGLVVGLAVIAVAKNGDMNLGVGAAGLAFVGLIIGKVLVAQFALPANMADIIIADPEMLGDAVYTDMVESDEVPPEVVAYYASEFNENEMISAELDAQLTQVSVQINERIDALSIDERHDIADAYAKSLLADVPYTERMGFSGYDLLWFGLALFTAFRVCATEPEETFV